MRTLSTFVLFAVLVCAFLTMHPAAAGELEDLAARAKGGDVEAEFQIGKGYEKGSFGGKDYHKARLWYAKAAKKQHAGALGNLGVLLIEGKGGAKNIRLGKTLYERAVPKGNRAAQFNLAVMYELGKLVPRDIDKAILLYMVASLEPNYSRPQYRLGKIYSNKDYKQYDKDKAIFWYTHAYFRGLFEARKRLHELGTVPKSYRPKALLPDISDPYRDLKMDRRSKVFPAREQLKNGAELSTEGVFFRPEGATNPMLSPMSETIGHFSAHLEVCGYTKVLQTFRDTVQEHIDQAQNQTAKDALLSRIRIAYQHRKKFNFMTACDSEKDAITMAATMVELMKYDWAFKELPTDFENDVIYGDKVFLIGNFPGPS